MSVLVMKHFWVSILFVWCVLWWWYEDDTACSIFSFLQKIFIFLRNEIMTCIGHYFPGWPILWKITLHPNVKLFVNNSLFDDWDLAVIIYNAKIVLIVQREYVCFNYSPWFAQYFIINDSLLAVCLLKIKTCRTIFTVFSTSAFVFIKYIVSHSEEPCFLYWCVVPVIVFEIPLVLWIWRHGGWVDSAWDSESTCCGFASQCCQLAGYITSLGKMWIPCIATGLEFGASPAWNVQHQPGSFPRDGSFLLGLK